MEAATPLPFAKVRTLNGVLLIDGLRVDDETAVRLASEREEAGENPDQLVRDAIEIGARVLDREQTGANADFVKAEFQKTARELDHEISERTRLMQEELRTQLDSVFGTESGVLTKALERHFSDDSAAAVQHRVKAVLDEVMTRSREELVRQFSSGDANNPLAGFQKATVESIRTASNQQHAHLREMNETITVLRGEVAALKAEQDKLDEVAAAQEKGTAKGRTYEEAVVEALDAIALARGDDCDAVGDVRGTGGRTGDAVVSIDACSGPARGRIVFEAKNKQLSKKGALTELDEALAGRDADYAVLVVPSDDKLPAKTHPLREYNGDKLFVSYDPEDGSRLALDVAYGLARARVLMKRGEAAGIDAALVRAEVERAMGAMEDVRRIKGQLTNATTGIEEARKIIDAMAAGVRAHLTQIDALLAEAEPAGDAEAGA